MPEEKGTWNSPYGKQRLQDLRNAIGNKTIVPWWVEGQDLDEWLHIYDLVRSLWSLNATKYEVRFTAVPIRITIAPSLPMIPGRTTPKGFRLSEPYEQREIRTVEWDLQTQQNIFNAVSSEINWAQTVLSSNISSDKDKEEAQLFIDSVETAVYDFVPRTLEQRQYGDLPSTVVTAPEFVRDPPYKESDFQEFFFAGENTPIQEERQRLLDDGANPLEVYSKLAAMFMLGWNDADPIAVESLSRSYYLQAEEAYKQKLRDPEVEKYSQAKGIDNPIIVAQIIASGLALTPEVQVLLDESSGNFSRSEKKDRARGLLMKLLPEWRPGLFPSEIPISGEVATEEELEKMDRMMSVVEQLAEDAVIWVTTWEPMTIMGIESSEAFKAYALGRIDAWVPEPTGGDIGELMRVARHKFFAEFPKTAEGTTDLVQFVSSDEVYNVLITTAAEAGVSFLEYLETEDADELMKNAFKEFKKLIIDRRALIDKKLKEFLPITIEDWATLELDTKTKFRLYVRDILMEDVGEDIEITNELIGGYEDEIQGMFVANQVSKDDRFEKVLRDVLPGIVDGFSDKLDSEQTAFVGYLKSVYGSLGVEEINKEFFRGKSDNLNKEFTKQFPEERPALRSSLFEIVRREYPELTGDNRLSFVNHLIATEIGDTKDTSAEAVWRDYGGIIEGHKNEDFPEGFDVNINPEIAQTLMQMYPTRFKTLADVTTIIASPFYGEFALAMEFSEDRLGYVRSVDGRNHLLKVVEAYDEAAIQTPEELDLGVEQKRLITRIASRLKLSPLELVHPSIAPILEEYAGVVMNRLEFLGVNPLEQPNAVSQYVIPEEDIAQLVEATKEIRPDPSVYERLIGPVLLEVSDRDKRAVIGTYIKSFDDYDRAIATGEFDGTWEEYVGQKEYSSAARAEIEATKVAHERLLDQLKGEADIRGEVYAPPDTFEEQQRDIMTLGTTAPWQRIYGPQQDKIITQLEAQFQGLYRSFLEEQQAGPSVLRGLLTQWDFSPAGIADVMPFAGDIVKRFAQEATPMAATVDPMTGEILIPHKFTPFKVFAGELGPEFFKPFVRFKRPVSVFTPPER